MFKTLVNEATLSFPLSVAGPLLINEGAGSKIDPTLPDMSFVRCRRNGEETVYLPGSSIKGVFRSRYEQVMRALSKDVCELFTKWVNCSDKIAQAEKNQKTKYGGQKRYEDSCAACRLFGSLALAGRAQFADGYPLKDTETIMGMRHGVGINRITGAAQNGVLFDIETVEGGTFALEIRLSNFALYQLRLLVWILQDIDDGLVTFGMGGSRGNGRMRIDTPDSVQLSYRLYDTSKGASKLRGYQEIDEGGLVSYTPTLFGQAAHLQGLPAILGAIGLDDGDSLRAAMQRERWPGEGGKGSAGTNIL